MVIFVLVEIRLMDWIRVETELLPQDESTTTSNSVGQVLVSIQHVHQALLLYIQHATLYGEATVILRLPAVRM